MDKWELIQLHDSGKMPDWAFYQQIDKYGLDIPFEMRIEQQKNIFLDEIDRRRKEEEQITMNEELQDRIEKAVADAIEKKLFS